MSRAALVEMETGRIVLPNVQIAETVWQRGVGLIGRKNWGDWGGLWLEPCNGVHTFGVRFALDVAAFDRDGTVLKTWEGVRPFRVCLPVARGRAVLELPAGSLAGLHLRHDCRYQVVRSPNCPESQ
jgi:uncharacterized protein